jgi:hypothetical protein
MNLPKGSPYTLMHGYTENGSPAEELVKLSFLPNRAEAVKFMTATPAPQRRLLRSSMRGGTQKQVTTVNILNLFFCISDMGGKRKRTNLNKHEESWTELSTLDVGLCLCPAITLISKQPNLKMKT